MDGVTENGIGSCPPGSAADHKRFIERHRADLLVQLDGIDSAPPGASRRYVDSVLTEWHERFDGSGLAPADPEEQTFWFALYQLEDVTESHGPRTHPFVRDMMQTLVEVRELLRQRKPLPAQRFMATRPDGS